ncbi:MAG: hypothetical protein DMG68_04180 [Acidobacteria bacterium]|nr:MAG: hypothetical protein DMG68_04180 [Acidobacteriota bacterium]
MCGNVALYLPTDVDGAVDARHLTGVLPGLDPQVTAELGAFARLLRIRLQGEREDDQYQAREQGEPRHISSPVIRDSTGNSTDEL